MKMNNIKIFVITLTMLFLTYVGYSQVTTLPHATDFEIQRLKMVQ